MIVSVSRRCDIPRYEFDWFMERLDDGFVDVANPFNARQIRRVSLKPRISIELPNEQINDGVDLFVFWTRDPHNILKNTDELTNRGFHFYVMVTVTGYPAILEPVRPDTHKTLEIIRKLSQKIGAERVIWRYDPIILTNVTDADFHRENFKNLSKELEGYVKRVIISLYDDYRGAKQRLGTMEKAGMLRMLDTDNIEETLAEIADSAKAADMEIQSCAEKDDFTHLGIKGGACIDPVLIKKLFNMDFNGKDKNQRPNCLCCQSVDIGSYGTCCAGCVYCYAR